MEQPPIPPMKDPKKTDLKIRGLASGLTFKERLRQFKKKDLAFILAGVAVLFLAPLAEHFLMAPESGAGGDWVKSGGTNLFSASPYETGGLSPGSPAGGGGDLITPLNARDPSALVMGPGAAQQPPAGSGAPQTTAPTDQALKDALAASAAGGVGEGIKKGPLAVPQIKLTNTNLRGLGVVTGGYNAAANSPPTSAGLVTSRPSLGGGLANVRPLPGYRGAAGPRGQTSGGGGEALKKAADAASGAFGRAGSAGAALEAAASEAIPAGGTAFGGGRPGPGSDKPFGGAGPHKPEKSIGESLAFIQAKRRLEKELDLEFKKREESDFALQGAKLRNKALETMSGKLAEAVIAPLDLKGLTKAASTGPWGYNCKPADNPSGDRVPVSSKDITDGVVDSQEKLEKGGTSSKTDYYFRKEDHTKLYVSGTTNLAYVDCKPIGGKAPEDKKTEPPPAGDPLLTLISNGDLNSLGRVCSYVDQTLDKKDVKSAFSAEETTYYAGFKSFSAKLIKLRRGLYGGANPDDAACATGDAVQAAGTFCPAVTPDAPGFRPVANEFGELITEVRGGTPRGVSVLGYLQRAIGLADGASVRNQYESEVTAMRGRFAANRQRKAELDKCYAQLAAPSAPPTGLPDDRKARAGKWAQALGLAYGAWGNMSGLSPAQGLNPLYEGFNMLLNGPQLGCVVRGVSPPANCGSLGATTGSPSDKGSLMFVVGTNFNLRAFAEAQGQGKNYSLPSPSGAVSSEALQTADVAQLSRELNAANAYIRGHKDTPQDTEAKKLVEGARALVQKVQDTQWAWLQKLKVQANLLDPNDYPTEAKVKAVVTFVPPAAEKK